MSSNIFWLLVCLPQADAEADFFFDATTQSQKGLQSLVAGESTENPISATVNGDSLYAKLRKDRLLRLDSWRLRIMANERKGDQDFLEVSFDKKFDTFRKLIVDLSETMKVLPEAVAEIEQWGSGTRQLPHLARHGVSETWVLDVAVSSSKPHVVVLAFRPTGSTWKTVKATRNGNQNELTFSWPMMHLVKVPKRKGLYFQTTEMTKRQWLNVMGTEPWKSFEEKGRLREGGYFKERGYFGPDSPATGMTWKSASKCCQRLTLRQRRLGFLAEDSIIKLPTEREWVTAALGGRSEEEANAYALNCEQYGFGRRSGPFKVASKRANPLGLFDMLGNVTEYCVDRDGLFRVCRGAPWSAEAPLVSHRSRVPDSLGNRRQGFRVVVSRDTRLKAEK